MPRETKFDREGNIILKVSWRDFLTATTAMMIAILQPLFGHFERRDPFKKALVLFVPFAANIGGMATIIGAPPNALPFAAQAVETRDMARYGSLLSLVGLVVMLAVLFLAQLVGLF